MRSSHISPLGLPSEVPFDEEFFSSLLSLENVFDEEYYVDAQEFGNLGPTVITPQNAIILGTLEQPRRLMGWVQYRF